MNFCNQIQFSPLLPNFFGGCGGAVDQSKGNYNIIISHTTTIDNTPAENTKSIISAYCDVSRVRASTPTMKPLQCFVMKIIKYPLDPLSALFQLVKQECLSTATAHPVESTKKIK